TTYSQRSLGEEIWKNKTQKVNAEIFTLTYGSIVTQLVDELNDDYHLVNKQLYEMGYNIGIRLIEDFLARTALPRCEDMLKCSEVISKCAFKIFLDIVPKVSSWSNDKKSFSLIIEDNPLSQFVEIPRNKDSNGATNKEELWYSNILCGIIKGALEMVQLDVECWFVSDEVKGDSQTEIRIKLNKVLVDEIPIGED
ncbi:TRAPP complex core subunit BET3 TBLA_0A09450, partial [Henningerozyma blattae CBS 6284]